MGWREWLGVQSWDAAQAGRTEVVGKIAGHLDRLPPDRARFGGAFAYHMGRIAHADHEFTGAERDVLRSFVATETGLPADEVDVVVDLVAAQSLAFRGTEDYAVMREFDEIATPEQKRALVRCLFAVSAADDRVVTAEDNEIRRIAIALKVPHEEFVAARASVRQHLAVLHRTAGRADTGSPTRDGGA